MPERKASIQEECTAVARLPVEALLSDCIQALCMPEDLEVSFAYVLERLGRYLYAQKVYLYRLNKEGWHILQQWNVNSLPTLQEM